MSKKGLRKRPPEELKPEPKHWLMCDCINCQNLSCFPHCSSARQLFCDKTAVEIGNYTQTKKIFLFLPNKSCTVDKGLGLYKIWLSGKASQAFSASTISPSAPSLCRRFTSFFSLNLRFSFCGTRGSMMFRF